MAQSLKDFKGWELHFEETGGDSAPATPTRRTRRTRGASLQISLSRIGDEITIKAGDFVLVQGNNGTILYLIKEIEHGVLRYLDVAAYRFIKALEIDTLKLEDSITKNEVYITAYVESIKLCDIVEKASVLSYAEFKSEIVVDDSNSFNTFFCRKGCDISGNHFSDELDFREFYKLFQTDKAHFK